MSEDDAMTMANTVARTIVRGRKHLGLTDTMGLCWLWMDRAIDEAARWADTPKNTARAVAHTLRWRVLADLRTERKRPRPFPLDHAREATVPFQGMSAESLLDDWCGDVGAKRLGRAWCYWWLGMTLREIGDQDGVSESAICQTINRLRTLIAARIR